MKMRIASISRKSKETKITVKVNIDGKGKTKINTRIGFLDHMLELFAFWGFFDLEITVAKGDLNIDIHHTNEDIGIVLGDAFKKALGDKKGIKRFGFFSLPMEDTVADVVVDISGRGFFQQKNYTFITNENYSFDYANHFFEAFAKRLGMNLNINIRSGLDKDLHKNLEPVFKALGIALDQATQLDPRRKGIPSTKGIID